MNSSLKKFGLALLILVTCVFFYERGKQQPMHWSETFNNKDKNPYGLYIFDQEAAQLLQAKKLTRFSSSVFNFLYQPDYDTVKTSNLILISGGYADLDEYTAKHLKKYIASGNTAFIAVENPKDSFLKAFGLQNGAEIPDAFGEKTEGVLSLTNQQLTKQKFRVKNSLNPRSFEILDSIKNNVEILGYRLVNDSIKQVNLVRIKHGKGELILSSSPLIFTNYYLLNSNNHLYIESVLSYLPLRDLTYMYVLKSGELKESSSLLRFIFANPALKWAWYFFLIGLIVFTLFTAKRRQRIIPIIPPVKNTTVAFTKTVSNLYIQSKDYNDLIHKSIIYSLEKIRRIYYIDTTVLDEKFVYHYQLKTNKDKADILAFVNLVNEFRRTSYLATEEDLVRLHQATKKILD
ncbi:hypothetical protein HX004_13545 [Myroides sp. 1354]|uniref:DUF4350 domain-containing protein n=1 Tax=unclassified Myroides TaxID=2642485 RepID=UPI00257544CF|nr:MULTISPECIES: DUF4350 domain-containing protein [unclassified Myroides]MDM1044506.1 hypothetical protein [Myroides sp. R163-1]MDM1056793.1 hypothetical protein [Myroides sp. 1354]MDM1069936.1 hypothetical protein [Myroides sp. 1372]